MYSVVLAAIGVLFAVPLVWLVLASLNPKASLELSLPESPSIDNYTTVLTPRFALLPLLNSTILSIGTATLTLAASVLAAYPLSRYKARFGRAFLYTILFGSGLPLIAIMIPVYAAFVTFGLIDNMLAAVLFLTATHLPMSIWMAKNFMDSVPVELEEAAWSDGASPLRALVSVVLPLMRPGLAVVFIFTVIGVWGEFFIPLLLLLSPNKIPAAVNIVSFFSEYQSTAYGELAAYSVAYSVPVLVLYLVVARALGGSPAAAGGLKG